MSDQPQQRPQDVMDFWRQWLTESERQFNAFFNSAMGSDAFGRSVGSYMETYAAFQKLLNDGMQRYLTFLNMPSRNDVVGLGETLSVIDARLQRIEEMLQIASDMSAGDRWNPPSPEPPRTRRPYGMPAQQPYPEQPAAYAPPPPQAPYAQPPYAQPPYYPPEPPAPPGPSLEAEALRALEDRLGRIEETLRIASEIVEASEHEVVEVRNGRVETPAVPEEPAAVIPEELRR